MIPGRTRSGGYFLGRGRFSRDYKTKTEAALTSVFGNPRLRKIYQEPAAKSKDKVPFGEGMWFDFGRSKRSIIAGIPRHGKTQCARTIVSSAIIDGIVDKAITLCDSAHEWWSIKESETDPEALEELHLLGIKPQGTPAFVVTFQSIYDEMLPEEQAQVDQVIHLDFADITIRELENILRLSPNNQADTRKLTIIREAYDTFSQDHGRSPNLDELINEVERGAGLEQSRESVKEMLNGLNYYKIFAESDTTPFNWREEMKKKRMLILTAPEFGDKWLLGAIVGLLIRKVKELKRLEEFRAARWVLIQDEASMFLSPRADKTLAREGYIDLTKRGPKLGISLIFIDQRMAEIDISIRRILDNAIQFSCGHQDDLDALFMSFSGAISPDKKEGMQILKDALSFPIGRCIYINREENYFRIGHAFRSRSRHTKEWQRATAAEYGPGHQ